MIFPRAFPHHYYSSRNSFRDLKTPGHPGGCCRRRTVVVRASARVPPARKQLGLLEKHSDYKKRADDYKKKTARLKTLTRKAAERNQDEFYFAMTKTVAGERRGPAGANSTHAATAVEFFEPAVT